MLRISRANIVAATALAALPVALAAGSAQAHGHRTTTCTGTISGVAVRDVYVPAGKSCEI